jgi:hypothetical protein
VLFKLQDLLFCTLAICLYHSLFSDPIGDGFINPKPSILTTNQIMSDVLVEWAKDHLNALYQKGIDSEEDRLSYTLSSIFDPGVHILYNHGPIGLEKFKEHLQAASTAVTKATVEWKEVVSLPKQGDTETEQVRIIISQLYLIHKTGVAGKG